MVDARAGGARGRDSDAARAMRRRSRACEGADACGVILVVERVMRDARRGGRGDAVVRGGGAGLEGFRSWGRTRVDDAREGARVRSRGVSGWRLTDACVLVRAGVASTFGVETETGKWTMMRHGSKAPQLNKPADQRKALLRGLTTELLRHGTVTTTMARAKALRKPVENMIQLAKDGDEYKKRMVKAYLYDDELAEALFAQAPQRYADRNGGYTRIVRTLNRRGDNAEMGVIRLV